MVTAAAESSRAAPTLRVSRGSLSVYAPGSLAPSKSDKKKTAGAKGAGAGSAAGRPSRETGRTGTSRTARNGAMGAKAAGPRKSSGGGKAGKAGAKTAPTGNKKAAAKARKVAVEAARPVERPGLAETRALAEQAIEVALDKKALVPVLIDVSAMASYTDFIAILSGKSDRQVDAIAEGITQFMKGKDRTIVGHEGGGGGRWTLLDFGDIVFHVFYHPVREFYDLESLWVDAPRVALQVPPEALRVQPDALY
jgi:ribosome-associated protein